MSRRESLARGAAALAVAGLVIKVSNLLVRVPLTRAMTAEGLGIYQMALPAFYALYHIAAGGVPVAVQNLVAEYTTKGRRAVAEQVLSMALTYSVLAGGAATLLLLTGAPLLAQMLGERRAAWSLVAVAPAVVLFATDAIYRNYLQGRKLMTPSATASVLEQGTKVAVTLLAAFALIRHGKAAAAAGAALGITAGAVISLLYMFYIYQRIRHEDGPLTDGLESRSLLARRMLKLAWPVTLGSVFMPVLSLMDVGIIQRGFLKAGFLQDQATAMYGYYSGIAVQVTWFPFVLTNALANAMIPVLAGAKARKDHQAVVDRVLLGLRATGLICLPVAFAVAVLAAPIAGLFGEPRAAVPLMYMAPVAYLGPLAWLMTAQLQALGRTGPPMRNFAIAMVIKLSLDALLAPVRGVDIKGVALASMTMFLIWCWMNARTLEDEIQERLPWVRLLQGPLLASVAMGGALFGLAAAGLLPRANWATVSLAVGLAPLLYLAILLGTRAVTWAELKELSGPVGARLERLLQTIWPFN
ncbi:MAG TPA: oligosaccharide flippase family protein [Symbiobacteriaceae bacterium]|nr:oligosaccharide flippase family protein [Symbiobacteriaceae bacterium]